MRLWLSEGMDVVELDLMSLWKEYRCGAMELSCGSVQLPARRFSALTTR